MWHRFIHPKCIAIAAKANYKEIGNIPFKVNSQAVGWNQ